MLAESRSTPMVDERPIDGNGKEGREAPGDAIPQRPAEQEDGQGRRNGRHRGFRGRHGRGRRAARMPGPAALARAVALHPARTKGRDRAAPAPKKRATCPPAPLWKARLRSLHRSLRKPGYGRAGAFRLRPRERKRLGKSLSPKRNSSISAPGPFGVVEYKDRDKSESAFIVKRRIQWEKEGEKKDWRKGLSSRISNL